ncbi:MAG: hypothetical protein ACXVEE_27535 [Polyangiales bacterium]
MTLRRALEEADPRVALARVEEALARGNPAVFFAAAHVLRVLGKHRRAFEALHRAEEDPRLAPRAHAIELEWMLRLGRFREARAFVAAHPNARFHARMAEELAASGCDERALAEVERAIALTPESASLLVHRAMLRTRVRQYQGALADLSRATELRSDAPVLLEAASLAMACGDFAAAESYAKRVDDARGRELLGRLALFRGDAHADGSATIRGGAAVLRGEMEQALEILREQDDAEAHAFRAEALLALDRPVEALAAADRAVGLARGPHLSARVLQHLSRMALETVQPSRPAFLELASPISILAPEIDVDAVMRDLPTAKRAFLQVLRALRGNRSTIATHVVGDRLVAVEVDPGPRFASRVVLQRIVADDEADVFRALDAVIEAYPESALPLAHRGEAHLWLGHYAEARRDLEHVIDRWPYTRWSYIGMTVLEAIEGNLEKALAICALGVERMRSEGPAVFVHRGEVLRRLGRHQEAEIDLRKACALNATRLSAPMNLALNHLARGNRAEAEAIHRDLLEKADGLLDDASTAIGTEEIAPVLEKALEMLRGNRSSSAVTYFAGEHLRNVILDASGDRVREGRRRDRERAVELAGHV